VLTICYGDTTTVDAGKNRDCYLWNDGSTYRFLIVDSPNLHGATSKQITVIVTDDGWAAFDTSIVNFIPWSGKKDQGPVLITRRISSENPVPRLLTGYKTDEDLMNAQGVRVEV
jgi:hypothetical protein